MLSTADTLSAMTMHAPSAKVASCRCGGADRPMLRRRAWIPAGPYRSLGVRAVVDQRDDDALGAAVNAC